MDNNRLTAERVVDLLRYKQERSRRPALAPVTPFRTLTAREVTHRQQMVSHLAGQRSAQAARTPRPPDFVRANPAK